jgi:tetratricopeptide (TPR) repeat protein
MKREHAVFLTAGIVVGFALGIALAWGFIQAPQPGIPASRGTGPPPAAPPPMGASSEETMTSVFERVEELRTRLEANPADAEAALELSNLQKQVGRFDEARQVLEDLLAADPGNVHGLTHLGLLLADQNDLDGARERFVLAVESDDTYWQGWFYLAATEARRGDYEASGRAADRLEALQPDLPELADLRNHLAEHGVGTAN